MKAILVAVDYADILGVTLPYNRHHFDEVMIVTTPTDLAIHKIAEENNATIYATTSFYDNGAVFNKWKALEEGLDALGREGWLCLMDADVMWPKQVPDYPREVGCLYTPLRRMMRKIRMPIPPEAEWDQFTLHRQQVEWAGFSQIFHCSDPHLGLAPWHEINWRHAGGADSIFQLKWPNNRKVRPPFEVLHLGPSGCNWCGRATERLDGTVPDGSEEKMQQVRNFIKTRRGKNGARRFDGEKIL